MLVKYFLEIRFPVQVEFFDGKAEKLKTFCPSDFQHWLISHDRNEYKFYNGDRLESSEEVFGFTPHNVVFSVEAPPTENYFQEKFAKLFKKALKWIDSPKSTRIGVRHWTLQNIPDMKRIVNWSLDGGVFNKQFASQFQGDQQIKDVAAVFESDKFKIQFGPMKKDPPTQYSTDIVGKGKISDTFFYADVDTFSKDVDRSDIVSEVKRLVHFNNSLTEKIFTGVEAIK